MTRAPPLYRKAIALVEERLGDVVICVRCRATIHTYADKCSAGLDEACPGFATAEQALRQAMRDVGFTP